MKVDGIGEFGLIGHLRKRRGVAGIGDDCAAVPFPGGTLLVTTDALVEGIHFRRETTSLLDLGYKAMTANLSDIAASGGVPLGAVVALALPEGMSVEEVEALYDGMEEAASPHGVAINGGDMTGSPGPLMITLTLWGRPSGPSPITRAGARPGDVLLLSGHPGDSHAGLLAIERGLAGGDPGLGRLAALHRRPASNSTLGAFLGMAGCVKAMVDTSDGLLADLGHIGEESGYGAIIDAAALPLSPDLLAAAPLLSIDPLATALSGGEDYLLLAAVEAGPAQEIADEAARQGLGPLTQIGEITAEPGLRLRHADGSLEEVRPQGWEHFRRER
jgi:thiamine-monophosphate kinase